MVQEKFVICLLSYLGSRFCGFAKQRGLLSVEGVLTEVFSKITKQTVKLKVAGRTDKGVHAVGQVVSFQSKLPKISEEQFTNL